jgi:hypothetical protein
MDFDNPAIKNTVDQSVSIINVSTPITGQIFPQGSGLPIPSLPFLSMSLIRAFIRFRVFLS